MEPNFGTPHDVRLFGCGLRADAGDGAQKVGVRPVGQAGAVGEAPRLEPSKPVRLGACAAVPRRYRWRARRQLSSPSVTEPTLWERVDEPVLRWAASLPPSLEMELHTLELREPQQFAPIPGLDSRDVHESLGRLVSHRLVDGFDSPTMQSTSWSKLRVTAFGWIVLGEWPDLDLVATAASLHRLLRALAEQAPEGERGPLLRAAGVRLPNS